MYQKNNLQKIQEKFNITNSAILEIDHDRLAEEKKICSTLDKMHNELISLIQLREVKYTEYQKIVPNNTKSKLQIMVELAQTKDEYRQKIWKKHQLNQQVVEISNRKNCYGAVKIDQLLDIQNQQENNETKIIALQEAVQKKEAELKKFLEEEHQQKEEKK